MLQDSHPRSLRGVVRRHPEGGAGSGVLRQAARNRWPREARDPARQALRPGCEELAARIRKANARRCRTAGAEGDGSAAPRPKTATVERREASVPRHGTQGASLGAWRAALCARPTGAAAPERLSALRPPPRFGVSEARVQTLGAENAPRERDGLFEIVSWDLPKTVRRRAASSAVLILRSARSEESPQNRNKRARVSKDEDDDGMALML